MTETKDIQLTKEMLSLLRKLAKGQHVPWGPIEDTAAAQSLQYYSLIYTSRSGNTVRITEKGMQALLYHENSEKARRSDRLHSWLIAIFSTIGGALLSKPIWTALEWLTNIIREML